MINLIEYSISDVIYYTHKLVVKMKKHDDIIEAIINDCFESDEQIKIEWLAFIDKYLAEKDRVKQYKMDNELNEIIDDWCERTYPLCYRGYP